MSLMKNEHDLIAKSVGRRQICRSMRKWEGNIKMDFKYIGCGLDLTDSRLLYANTVMNFRADCIFNPITERLQRTCFS